MPDWDRFRAAVTAGAPPLRLAQACEKIWSWLPLTCDARSVALERAIADAPAAMTHWRALPLVRGRLWREQGSADQRAAVDGVGQWILARYPAAAQPIGEPDPQVEAILQALPPLQRAMHACSTDRATPALLSALLGAIERFDAVAVGAPTMHADHAWWVAQACVQAGMAEVQLGHGDGARACFERARQRFNVAGALPLAAECGERLAALARGAAADFDAAARRDLSVLLARATLPEQARALASLAQETQRAGDVFGAARTAEELATLLADNRYPDPEAGGATSGEAEVERAFDAWVKTVAAADAPGENFLARLFAIIEYYVLVLSIRSNARRSADPEGSARAERLQRALAGYVPMAGQHAEAAHAEVERRLAPWFDETLDPAEPPEASVPPGEHSLAWQNAFDDALHRVRLACNARPDVKQLDALAQLQAQAESLGARLPRVQVRLEHAYVLLALDRPNEVAPVLDGLLQILFEARPRELGSLTQSAEREFYLMAMLYQARALAALKDRSGLLAACLPVIADIETQRARVNSPYAQSAFLSTRSELYELAAVAAYKLGERDRVLGISELLKARAALGLRAPRRDDAKVVELDERCRAATAALAAADPAAAATDALRQTRRWLFEARALAAAQASEGVMPGQAQIAAIQGTLATDEAALSWFWLGEDVLLVQMIAANRDDLTHIVLDEEGRALLDRHLACVIALAQSPTDEQLEPLINELEAVVPALGAVLLAPVQAFLRGCTRLIISAHRKLHLFPFHAAPLEGAPLITRCAVRYVPNLSSLLLPWQGAKLKRVLAVGVGAFERGGYAPLPGAHREAQDVAKAHGADGQYLLDATRADLLHAPLHDLRCLHLATHGSSVLVGDALDDPSGCGIELRDGALDGQALSLLDLRAELVVLAACHSGQRAIGGRGLAQLPGDDLFGLQAALFSAGAHALLAALWPVDDDSVCAILTDFHRAYAGGSAPDRALQSAIVAHLAAPERRHTLYDWAPLFITALGQGPEPKKKASPRKTPTKKAGRPKSARAR